MILDEKLFNNRILTERFSESMPKWLQSRLLFTKPGLSSAKKDEYQNKGFDMNNQAKPDYSSRGDRRSIFTLFNEAGINLDTAEFIGGGIPVSNRDPRLKDPYIPIFLLQGEDWRGNVRTQVYAKGINDDELFEFGDTEKKLGYVPMKTLLNSCIDFCAINTSDTDNYGATEKRSERNAIKKELRNNPFTRYTPEEQKQFYRGQFDKSGHLINPEELKRRLAEYKASNSARVIEKLYRRITNIKNDFAQIYLNSNIEDFDKDPDFVDIFNDGYRGLNAQLVDIVRDYNRFVKDVNNILNDDMKSEEEKRTAVSNYFTYYYNSIDTAINNLEKKAERVLSVDLDWD